MQWAKDLYVNVKKGSRWHSSNAGLVRTADTLGDHFVWKLREAAQAAEADDTIARFASGLFDQLRAYDRESRLLVKLADTGRIVLYFERAVDTALGMMNLLDSPAKTSWHQRLQQEREERMVLYETLLADEDRLVCEMGDERQQLEILTLLRHGLEQYGEMVLTPRELDVISAVYDVVAWNWNGVAGVVPEWFTTARWELITRMCAADPTARIYVEDAVYTMEVLANEETGTDTNTEAITATTSEDVKMYVIPTANETFEEVFQGAGELFGQAEELSDFHRSVYDRLVNVYEQLEEMSTKPSRLLVDGFAIIVWRFYRNLERDALDSFSIVDTMCASHTIAGKNYRLHYQIDHLLRGTAELDSTDPVHRWQPVMEHLRQRQRQQLHSYLENPPQRLSQSVTMKEKAEAEALLQFGANNNGGAVGTATRTRIQTEPMEYRILDATELPQWFIPAHQVELQGHIADGSFGAVFHGKWLGTDVVVKQVLTDQSDRENRKQVVQEANLWFKLNHDNLIKLYGACHEGQPFFVCERAIHGTMVSLANGSSREGIWWMIYQAAQGLQHLHECGIVHADLKGNNILVCEGYVAKLADFGLSAVADRTGLSAAGEGALGAFRWKAPECLLGAPPTFASDMYAFGMCVIETLTGVYPWGNSIPDEAVKFHVTQQRLIPPRPDNFLDSEWDLVTRMCYFEPELRISAGAVVHLALKARWAVMRNLTSAGSSG
ncbi:hypothetical protein BBJ28_00024474 [Nothophytophthora sp. Chile5]|nr:hypothetical protein BBJ28_00024474 [Nothophytophthora sp. Chile5]